MTGRLAAKTHRPAAFHYSRSRAGEHPQGHPAGYVGLMLADAFDGYNQLYKAQRKPAPILEAACWSHGRRKFVDLVKQGEAPIASEAVRPIDMLFEIERSINSKTPEQRLAAHREQSRPLIAELEIWMRQQRALLSTTNDTAKAINYLGRRATTPSALHFLGHACVRDTYWYLSACPELMEEAARRLDRRWEVTP